MTPQPKYMLTDNMGDASFADFGGALLYQDTTGVYDPQIEYYETSDDETGGNVYRFDVEPVFYTFTKTAGMILSDNPYHLDYEVWWYRSLDAIANGLEIDKSEIIRKLVYGTIQERASIYIEIGLYEGFSNFDAYPLNLTEAEAQERYKDIPNH